MLARIFGKSDPRDALRPLYDAGIAVARDPVWYRDGGVPDTLDGRFDMVAAVLSLVLIRLEAEGEAARSASALLAELFVRDMDGQLREAGIGDVIVGKHIGRMMGALGGRLTAYREGFCEGGDPRPALVRNLWRGAAPADAALDFTAGRLRGFADALGRRPVAAILGGELPRP